MAADVPLFNKDKHVSYWLRCLRTPLPNAYTSNDAQRITLAFFTVSALDLLGILFTSTTEEERNDYTEWIYGFQHPQGGFRGFPGTDYGAHANADNAIWDPANLAATCFAINALCVLGDDLQRIDRRACLAFVKSLQMKNGGFAELKIGDEQVGGGDPRFAYVAACVRWIVRGTKREESDGVPDIDVPALVQWVRRAEARDGGYAENSSYEPHAGLTFCALATLRLLSRTGQLEPSLRSDDGTTEIPERALLHGPDDLDIINREKTLGWLVNRFTTEINEEEYYDSSDDSAPLMKDSQSQHDVGSKPGSGPGAKTRTSNTFQKIRSSPARERAAGKRGLKADAFHAEKTRPVCWAGFGGRCNKVADTCYAFWAGASLKMLDGLDCVNLEHVRCYLHEKTQNMILGGFGKFPGDAPDIYHSYFGLAALALIDGHKQDGEYIGPDIEDASKVSSRRIAQPETAARASDRDRTVRALDPVLCISNSAKKWIESLDWHKPA